MDTKKVNYSMTQNVWYVLRHMWKWDKQGVFWYVFSVPFSVLISIFETYMAKTVVQIVTEQGTPQELVVCVMLFFAGMVLLYVIKNIGDGRTEAGMRSISDRFCMLYEERYMQIDYEKLETSAFQMTAEKAREAAAAEYRPVIWMMLQFLRFCSAVLGVFAYCVILIPLSPVLIIIMVAISTAGYFIYGYNHKWERNNRSKWAAAGKKLWYNMDKFRDVQAAQDVMLYRMLPWLEGIFRRDIKEANSWIRYRQLRWKIVDTIFAFLTLARDFLVYGILIYQVYTGGMSAADFVLYFNALLQFIRWLLQLYDGMDMARFRSNEFSGFRDFMEIQDSSYECGGRPVPEDTFGIQFKGVSYTYPGNEEAALSEVSFTIRKGEKIAIVGPNGAGKTTLVKLMCGLYRPMKGEILADGHSIREYPREAYYSLFSSVFQDIAYMPKTIAENIALCPEKMIEKKRLAAAIKLSGLEEKLGRLPKGSNTLLVKKIREGAMNLSGGEKQKLALARALYKEGKMIILDEPTAALDPIAESEIYQKYNELSAGRTSVFISHRLASTRFCDRIFYVERGQIMEAGTHQELLSAGGKYAEMYKIQSQYYQKTDKPVEEEGDWDE